MQKDSIKSLLPKFVLSLEDKGRSPATILAYRSDLEQLVEFLTKTNISSPDQIKADNLDIVGELKKSLNEILI